MNRLDFIVDWYHRENERRTALNNEISIPLGILTAVILTLFFELQHFDFTAPYSVLPIITFVPFGIASVLICIFIAYQLIMSYGGFGGEGGSYEYDGLPLPTDLNEHYKRLENFVDENAENLDEAVTPDSLFKEQLLEQLAEYLSTNIDNNDRRANHLYKARNMLFTLLFFVIMTSAAFIINYAQQRKDSTNYSIEELDRMKTFFDEIIDLKLEQYESKSQNKSNPEPTELPTKEDNSRGDSTTSKKIE